jgi:hypothetical protein
MNDWHFEAAADSEPGTVAPRIPRHRPLILRACSGNCNQGRRWCANPARCEARLPVRVPDTFKGALIGAALALLGVAALHLWSR